MLKPRVATGFGTLTALMPDENRLRRPGLTPKRPRHIEFVLEPNPSAKWAKTGRVPKSLTDKLDKAGEAIGADVSCQVHDGEVIVCLDYLEGAGHISQELLDQLATRLSSKPRAAVTRRP